MLEEKDQWELSTQQLALKCAKEVLALQYRLARFEDDCITSLEAIKEAIERPKDYNVWQVPIPKRSKHWHDMMDVAKQYYRLLEMGKDADEDEKKKIRDKLDELVAPFSDDPGFHAFLAMERCAAGLDKESD